MCRSRNGFGFGVVRHRWSDGIERRIPVSHDVVHPVAGSGYGRAGKPCGRRHQRPTLAQVTADRGLHEPVTCLPEVVTRIVVIPARLRIESPGRVVSGVTCH